MKTRFYLGIAICLFISQAAGADIVFSTSATDANAGSDFSFQLGTVNSIFVHVSTESGQTINGLSLDIFSSNPGVLEAIDHNIENPNIFGSIDRWTGTDGGIHGDLIDNSNALAILDAGLSTSGLTDFQLHSRIDVMATAEGATALSFAEGENLVTDTDSIGSIWSTISAGSGSVNVTAVPEPTSTALVVLGASLFAFRRRRG